MLSLAFPSETVSAEEREIVQTIHHFEEEGLYILLEAAETISKNHLQEGKEEQLIAHFRSYGVNHSEAQEISVVKCAATAILGLDGVIEHWL